MTAPTRPVARYYGGLALRYAVDLRSGCHVWQGATSNGYGIVGTNRRGTFRAHRMAWEAEHGPLSPGVQLDQLCRNRACINPAHLEPVTNAENARRGAKAKLTWRDVRAIRSEYSDRRTPFRALAARYGVSSCAISNVVNGKRWQEALDAG